MAIARGAGLLMLASAGAAHAGPLFDAAFLAFPLNGSASFIASGDLNGDGRRDLVTSTQSGTVRVALGLGDGTFTAPAVYGVSSGGSPPVIADLTGDGTLDIAIADFPNTSVGILRGNGDGTFADTVKVATGFQCYTMLAVRMDGDSIPDLVVANWTEVGVLLGNPNGTFGAMTTFPTGTNAYRLAAGDLNDDGHADVVSSGDYSQVTVLQGIGGGFLQPGQGFTLSTSINELEVVDATGDGVPDVVAAVGTGVTIIPGNGDGTFQPRIDLTPLTSHGSCEVGDLNGDTHPDIVTIGQNFPNPSNVMVVLFGDGLGGFPIQRQIETLYSLIDVELADVDGDGAPDLVAVNATGLVAVHLGNGDGTFGTIRRYSTGADPVAVALGDLDGDARADLVVAHRGSASISVRAGGGNGAFGIRRDYDANLARPVALALGDLDGDGHADVAVADAPGSGTPGVRVFNGYANASFTTTGSYPTGFQPSGIAIGDLDGDGDRDLVVTDELANRASVLLNSGAGAFLAAVHYGAGVGASGVAIGDLNGDLHADVATANRQAGSVTVLFGDGDGSFTGEVELQTAPDCRAIAIGLVNADAIPDLVTANGTSSTVSVLLGQGGGAFAPATALETGLVPASIVITALDGDALPDLVVGAGNAQNNVIAAMLGSGDGAFQPAFLLASGDQPEAVAVADLDGSGAPDIVAANRLSETVTVLLNTTSVVAVASATAPVEFALGHGYPNPSPAWVTLRYAIPSPSEAALRVYDASGRLVRVLAEGVMPAGEHLAVWDRRTDHGTRAAAGVYFCDLRVRGRHVTRRIVLL